MREDDPHPATAANAAFWPEFQQISSTLRAYLDEVTARILAEVIHADSSEAVEVAETKQRGAGPVERDDE